MELDGYQNNIECNDMTWQNNYINLSNYFLSIFALIKYIFQSKLAKQGNFWTWIWRMTCTYRLKYNAFHHDILAISFVGSE